MFLSGLPWLRWVLWGTALSALAFHLIFLSQPTRAAWGPGAEQVIVTMLLGRICCWFRSEILFSLGNLQRNLGIWHACPRQVWKKLLQSELSAEVDYLRETQGDGCLTYPAYASGTKVLGKCVRLSSRDLCIDVSGFWCTSSGTLAVCWHCWAQFLCLSWFFYHLPQGFSSSSEKHPNKTLKTWGAGECKSCSWPSSKSQFWAVKCKFLRRKNMFL